MPVKPVAISPKRSRANAVAENGVFARRGELIAAQEKESRAPGNPSSLIIEITMDGSDMVELVRLKKLTKKFSVSSTTRSPDT